jgi:hypothetical protein
VKPTDLEVLAIPAPAILSAAFFAAAAPVLRAGRIDPVALLRAE